MKGCPPHPITMRARNNIQNVLFRVSCHVCHARVWKCAYDDRNEYTKIKQRPSKRHKHYDENDEFNFKRIEHCSNIGSEQSNQKYCLWGFELLLLQNCFWIYRIHSILIEWTGFIAAFGRHSLSHTHTHQPTQNYNRNEIFKYKTLLGRVNAYLCRRPSRCCYRQLFERWRWPFCWWWCCCVVWVPPPLLLLLTKYDCVLRVAVLDCNDMFWANALRSCRLLLLCNFLMTPDFRSFYTFRFVLFWSKLINLWCGCGNLRLHRNNVEQWEEEEEKKWFLYCNSSVFVELICFSLHSNWSKWRYRVATAEWLKCFVSSVDWLSLAIFFKTIAGAFVCVRMHVNSWNWYSYRSRIQSTTTNDYMHDDDDGDVVTM